MSVLPVKPMIPSEQALLFVEAVQKRLTPVSLDQWEYFEAIQKAAEQGLTGGRIYDALLLRCAAKCNARSIYTWNLKHFQMIAPELAGRIRTP
jgi:predicted nucleic acid-binding protein